MKKMPNFLLVLHHLFVKMEFKRFIPYIFVNVTEIVAIRLQMMQMFISERHTHTNMQ